VGVRVYDELFQMTISVPGGYRRESGRVTVLAPGRTARNTVGESVSVLRSMLSVIS
jgi:hypothetical protein